MMIVVNSDWPPSIRLRTMMEECIKDMCFMPIEMPTKTISSVTQAVDIHKDISFYRNSHHSQNAQFPISNGIGSGSAEDGNETPMKGLQKTRSSATQMTGIHEHSTFYEDSPKELTAQFSKGIAKRLVCESTSRNDADSLDNGCPNQNVCSF